MAGLTELGGHFMRDLGSSPLLVVFVSLVAFDYVTGVLKAVAWKVGDSAVGLKGLIKHTLVIISIIGVTYISNVYDVHEVAFVVTIMYSINYLISILENFAVMGIYTPKFLITKLKSELKRYEDKLNDAGEDTPDIDEFLKSGKKVKKEETTND